MTKRFVLVAGNIGAGKTSLTERLAARMGELTQADGPLVLKTLRYFAEAGYLKNVVLGNRTCWYWTHNRAVDRLPEAVGSAPRQIPLPS